MPNRQLSAEERRALFGPLFEEVQSRLVDLSGGDAELFWALRRKLYKELSYLERSKPSVRKRLKQQKRREQGNLCPVCNNLLPDVNVVLDRVEAMKGYTAANTRLICRDCDYEAQRQRRFT